MLPALGSLHGPVKRIPIDAVSKAANDTSKSLYDRNRAVYELLRYGVKSQTKVRAPTDTGRPIDRNVPED